MKGMSVKRGVSTYVSYALSSSLLFLSLCVLAHSCSFHTVTVIVIMIIGHTHTHIFCSGGAEGEEKGEKVVGRWA